MIDSGRNLYSDVSNCLSEFVYMSVCLKHLSLKVF